MEHKFVKYINILLLSISAVFALSCEKQHSEPQEIPDGLDISVRVNGVDGTEASVTYTPDNQDDTYYVSAISKESYISHDGDAYVVDRDMVLIESYASQAGITVKDYLSEVLKKGETTEVFSALSPDTEYYAYGYAMDIDGNAGMKVFRAEFVTEARDFSDYSFAFANIDAGKESYSLTVKPQDATTPYFYAFIDDDTFAAAGGDTELYVQEYFKYCQERYNIPADELVNTLCSAGERAFEHTGLLPKTKYYSLAAVMDPSGIVKSKVSSAQVETLPIDYMETEFAIEPIEIGFNYAKINVTPSDENPYLSVVMEKELADSFASDEKMMMDIIESFGIYMPWSAYSGAVNIDIDELSPASEYSVVAFGVNTNTYMYTTHLFRFDFTTSEAPDTEDISFEITIDEITPYSASISYVPSTAGVFYMYEAVPKSVYEEYGADDAGLQEYMDMIIAQLQAQFQDYTVAEIVSMLGSDVTFVYDDRYLDADTEYYAWAAACDSEGKFVSKVSMEGFATPAYEEGDAGVTVAADKYFDGDELAELDPVTYGDLAGHAVLTADYKSEAGAVHWYTRAYEGDLTSGDIIDAELTKDLVVNGLKDKPRVIFSLPWDLELTLCTVAVGEDGIFGKVVKNVMTLSKENASPADEFELEASAACESPVYFGFYGDSAADLHMAAASAIQWLSGADPEESGRQVAVKCLVI